MKTTLCFWGTLAVALFGFFQAAAASADTNGFRLTVELQDGSKLTGRAGDQAYQFRSDVLGELKLPLERIRSVAWPAKTNAVKLTTAGGDSISAQFTMTEIRIETTFGKIKLPVNQLRQIQVSAAGKAAKNRPGLIALWSGEGDGRDSVGGNDAELNNVSFAEGKVGQAFNFDGASGYVNVPSSPSLKFVNAFTVVAWVNLNSSPGLGTVTIATKGSDADVSMDWMLSIRDRHLCPAATVDGSWQGGNCASTLAPGVWYHVAMTFDGSNLRGYVNGELDGTFPMSGTVRATDYALRIGAYAPVSGSTANHAFFPGKIDELSLYNRALSAEEIKDIGIEENHGDPLPVPQPSPFSQSIRTFDGFDRNGIN